MQDMAEESKTAQEETQLNSTLAYMYEIYYLIAPACLGDADMCATPQYFVGMRI